MCLSESQSLPSFHHLLHNRMCTRLHVRWLHSLPTTCAVRAKGGGGIISATLWHTLLIIGGFKATGRARRVSGHCSHRRRLSVLVAVWHWHTGLGPPTVSSTDAVSGLRIRYFTLQLLLLLLLLRLPLQVSLERNCTTYYYSVPPSPHLTYATGLVYLTLQILVGEKIPTFVSFIIISTDRSKPSTTRATVYVVFVDALHLLLGTRVIDRVWNVFGLARDKRRREKGREKEREKERCMVSEQYSWQRPPGISRRHIRSSHIRDGEGTTSTPQAHCPRRIPTRLG